MDKLVKVVDERFVGNDNQGNPRSEYLDRISKMADEELFNETDSKIWLSAFVANNPRSDYHWHVDALYLECKKRPGDIYQKAYDQAFKR